MEGILHFIKKKRYLFIFLCIVCVNLFFRFYQLEARMQFSWDQVDNAWHAKNMLINKEYPLLGMQGKQDSGLFIGPFYYYFITFFYLLTNLDPIAGGIAAGVTSLITIVVLYLITRRLFSEKVALVASFLYAISFYVIYADRIQWPVNFIPVLSLAIFYSLYQLIQGKHIYFYVLALLLGFSFHIHFTAVFYVLFVLLSIPFFPRNKKTLYHGLSALPLFVVWLLPIFFASTLSSRPANNFSSFLANNYHGFHLRRFSQLANDAFFEFQNPFIFPALFFLKFLIFPFFVYLYTLTKPTKQKTIFTVLLGAWILIPWLLFTAYKGDITNYYFSHVRLFVLMIFAFFIVLALEQKRRLVTIGIALLLTLYTIKNILLFTSYKEDGLLHYKNFVLQNMKEGKGNEFTYGSPETYLYYYYKRKFWGVE